MKAVGKIVLGASAAVMALSASARADVGAGFEAYKRGDFATALREWRDPAAKGDPDAQFNLGQLYRLGRGVPVNAALAQSWYQKAAVQGHLPAAANYGIMLYESGKRREAMPWIRKAADAGEPRAQYILGVELTNGELVGRDFVRAYALMTRSAAQGVPAAGRALEKMGSFVPPADRQKGIALARRMEQSGAGLASATSVSEGGSAPSRTPAPTKGAVAAPVAASAGLPRTGGWRAQLGAYGSPAAAQAQWNMLRAKIGGAAGLQPAYEKAGALTRLRVGPLASRAAADRFCASAKAAGQACFPVAP